MRKIVAAGEPFERFERPNAGQLGLVRDLGQDYKVEHIQDPNSELSRSDTLSFYRQGEFIDLCRGPHIPRRQGRALQAAQPRRRYWKNDSSRKQLQRLYGTAFFSQKDLDTYVHQLEEARKRDHRLLGKQLKLFTISPTAGSGLILWMPRGATVRNLLETFIRDELVKRGYQPVYTPHIGRLELYRTSGHFPYYRDAQFPPMYFNAVGSALDLAHYRMSCGHLDEAKERRFQELLDLAQYAVPGYQGAHTTDERLEAIHRSVKLLLQATGLTIKDYDKATTHEERAKALWAWLESQEGYLLKPMNCPHHIQIYKAEPRSYRDLPVRLAEFGTVYRFEQTGELSGMTRVRGFTQDDAHLFVTPDQIESEMEANIDLVLFVLTSLGLTDYRVRVSLRDPGSDKYVGSPENWDRAEEILKRLVQGRGMNFTLEPGEAAFYGPKIDFVVRDCIGREWQLGTVQLDYNLPERFGLEYVGADNRAHRPVMIHRAPFGSMERFMGILIEHFAGAFPLWLAPEQVRVMPITDRFIDYGRQLEGRLRTAGFRVSGDYRPEKVNFKIREAQLDKIPYMLVVGEKEATAGTVSVRDRVAGDLGAMPVDALLARLTEELTAKTIRQVSTASAGLTDKSFKFGQ
ncbi:MAG: threonine--tRNA ligase [Gemmataceae bacterium]